ncbi:lytic transglycosylase domain-containing protein [Saccharomonospora sp. NPDC046836]|uniref:lytic transglycosylase domain-containing protein n=1 Tax=Saccharomonospora sp. NPDC046836 TaxID=3156921 RepID=UPI0033E5D419
MRHRKHRCRTSLRRSATLLTASLATLAAAPVLADLALQEPPGPLAASRGAVVTALPPAETIISTPAWVEHTVPSVPLPEISAPERVAGNSQPAGAVSYALVGGIPDVALSAYRNAAGSLAQTAPGCGLEWTVIAAIGRVESNHGRYGGTQLYEDGSTHPVIRGIPLDGRTGVALIRDSDGGALDQDPVFDRAVGPMQFIPGTWRAYAVDGNGDGEADPDNIHDAALAAGTYLCAGGGDTRDPAQLRAAVYRYNHSESYVDMVLTIATAYGRGEVPVLPARPGGAPSTPSTTLPPATKDTVPPSASVTSTRPAPSTDESPTPSTPDTTTTPPATSTTESSPPSTTSTTPPPDTTSTGVPSSTTTTTTTPAPDAEPSTTTTPSTTEAPSTTATTETTSTTPVG